VTRAEPGYVEPFGAADAVVVAVPAPIAARIVPEGIPGRPEWIEDVPYSSEVAVIAFRRHAGGERGQMSWIRRRESVRRARAAMMIEIGWSGWR
jgi:hypothetical protein